MSGACAEGVQISDTPHPDAALLSLCAQLRDMQAEWQRLYDLTPDDGARTSADEVWERYASHVWPGVGPVGPWLAPDEDVPGRLLLHHPSTLEGLAAKAAAILALDDAAHYTRDCRDDAFEMQESLLKDVVRVGADAAAHPVQP